MGLRSRLCGRAEDTEINLKSSDTEDFKLISSQSENTLSKEKNFALAAAEPGSFGVRSPSAVKAFLLSELIQT